MVHLKKIMKAMPYTWNNYAIPITQLGPEFYDVVQPAVFPQMKLRYWNDAIPLKILKERLWDFKPLENYLSTPLALRYHGHQFQHYNPDLGDGRGFLYAQHLVADQWYDLGTKGSGTTPYSRRGDGRLTLKGAFREALATELLESLGVDTSKTFCIYETGEALERSDEPSPTRSAVLTRFSRGHIRIGTFQRLAFLAQQDSAQIESLKKLTEYCLNFYYQEDYQKIDLNDDMMIATTFLRRVCEENAKLVAQVMMAGFVHGVLNTDNINISGELFDYGPYRFLPHYDPEFTAAYFDGQGLYSFGRQPHTFLWNLHQLGFSLSKAYPGLPFENILEEFSSHFNEHLQKRFQIRLNLKSDDKDMISETISLFFKLMDEKHLLFEQTFFDFHSFNEMRLQRSPQKEFYTGEIFEKLKQHLNTLTIVDSEKAKASYFKNPKPCSLLIDEIEHLWTFISKDDNWTPFDEKLKQIRSFRGLY